MIRVFLFRLRWQAPARGSRFPKTRSCVAMHPSESEPRVCYRFPQPLVSGRLIRRYKRFLADMLLDTGETVTVHCPNSGSMLGCIEDGAPVMLSESGNPNRKTRFTWEMIHINGDWIGINTGIPNLLALEAARKRALSIFSNAVEARKEVKISDRSRIDLMVTEESRSLFVEVKNVTLTREGIARFPDAVTARGAKHLEELMRLAVEGHGAAMLYIVQRSDAWAFGPADDIDPVYAETYYKARQRGVTITVAHAQVTPECICLTKEMPVLI